MVILIKFTPGEYVESFQCGNLHMNALDYFWKNGFEEQKDILEGIIASIKPVDLHIGLDPRFVKIMCADSRFQACGYAYCNVLCMSQIDVAPDKFGRLAVTMPTDMNSFGEYAIVVDNEAEFLRRIDAAAKRLNYKYLCGHVNYHKPKLNGGDITAKHDLLLKSSEPIDIEPILTKCQHKSYDSFDKSTKYKSQNEWRLSLYRGAQSTEAYTFNIGDIHDITHRVKTSELNIGNEIRNSKFLNKSVDCYYGNSSRKELRELFYKLGDYKGWMFSSIG